jgi:hypothetical protein
MCQQWGTERLSDEFATSAHTRRKLDIEKELNIPDRGAGSVRSVTEKGISIFTAGLFGQPTLLCHCCTPLPMRNHIADVMERASVFICLPSFSYVSSVTNISALKGKRVSWNSREVYCGAIVKKYVSASQYLNLQFRELFRSVRNRLRR